MNRRKFLKSAATVPLITGGAAFSSVSPSSSKTANGEAASPGDAPLHDRYEITLRRVLSGTAPAYTEEFLLADVRPTPGRRFTEYSGDLSGRYIGALATAARVYGTGFPKLDSLVAKVMALQAPDGYFGSTFHYDKPTDNDLALLWGNGRLLVGLLEYYRYQPEASVLATCKRLGDFLLRIAALMLSKSIRDEFGAAHFASSYICWTQQTEGLANLYAVTHNEHYRALAEQIAAVIERRPADHVHGYLTSLRGVMDLYQFTSDNRLLHQCEAAWREVAESEDLLITGGVPEGWSPNKHRTEGCAEVDWLRLNLALWKATSHPKYLAATERVTFNELALNQFASGDFGHRVLTSSGISGDAAARAWWCCTLHGLRYFSDVQASAFRGEAGTLYYELPIDSDVANGRVPSASLSAIAASSLAHNGTVKITISSATEAPASLRVRKPRWADSLAVRLNGNAMQSSSEGDYVGVHRQWQHGDVLTVNYGMSLQRQSSDQKRITFSYGPWLLGAPAYDNPAYFNELTIENKLAVAKSEAATANPNRPFTVPIAARTFAYAPAEFPEQQGMVTLRAVAEQTGVPTTAWELHFLSDSSV
jgi:DUF1680 family protein